MFLYDEKRIINTDSVERFGFVDRNFLHTFDSSTNASSSFYITSEVTCDTGAVIAEFKVHQVCDILYKGSGKSCSEFYVNLIKALIDGKRVVHIQELHPAEPD